MGRELRPFKEDSKTNKQTKQTAGRVRQGKNDNALSQNMREEHLRNKQVVVHCREAGFAGAEIVLLEHNS